MGVVYVCFTGLCHDYARCVCVCVIGHDLVLFEHVVGMCHDSAAYSCVCVCVCV